MRAVLVAVVALALAAPAEAVVVQFRTPSDLDLTGYQLGPRGRATVVCAGDTAVDKRARALRYGSKWSRGGFTCTSKKTGLRCRNRSGHGFFLSRARSFRF